MDRLVDTLSRYSQFHSNLEDELHFRKYRSGTKLAKPKRLAMRLVMVEIAAVRAWLQKPALATSRQLGGPSVATFALLGLWTATLLLPSPAESCMETAWKHGHLGNETLLSGTTLTDASSGSCRCCGLCHRNPACASLSFNILTAECELYSSVASYATLQPDAEEEWTYFVMPGRSETGQFCRQDSDCLVEGEACRGRVCTERSSVTCRVICEEFGAGTRYGWYIPGMYGWLNGQTLMLTCLMTWSDEGFTQLLYSPYMGWKERQAVYGHGFRFSRDTVLDYNRALDDYRQPRSILVLGDYLRLSNNVTSNYTIQVWTQQNSIFLLTTYQSSRQEPVLAEAPREDVQFEQEWECWLKSGCRTWRGTKLYMPPSDTTLVSINADAAQASSYWGALASTRQYNIIEFALVQVYIRE